MNESAGVLALKSASRVRNHVLEEMNEAKIKPPIILVQSIPRCIFFAGPSLIQSIIACMTFTEYFRKFHCKIALWECCKHALLELLRV